MPGWRQELKRLLLLLAVGLSGLWWSPWPFLPLAVISLLILFWHLRQAIRMKHWLTRYESQEAPTTSGIWQDLIKLSLRPTKRSQRYRHKLQALFDRLQDSTSALQEGIIMVDRHGNLEWWNRSAGKMLGLRDPIDINQPITNLIRAPEFTAYFSRGEFDTPLELNSPIAKDMCLSLNITPFGRNERLIVAHDVSRLRQLEQMRKDFVGNVSHELRTPLTVIQGYLETFEDIIPERARRMLTQMQEQASRMDSLVRDLLALSRLENGAHDPRTSVDVLTLLEQITEEAIAVSAGKQDIRLNIESDDSLSGYEHELRSAFTNIIINAVKYTPSGGSIHIRWYRDGESLCLEVKDSGIGIEEHHLPRLTERFYRADPSRSKNTGGTGLGLAIVKHVLLRHAGNLLVTSDYGKGSCFTACFEAPVHLPASADFRNETRKHG